MPLSNSDDLFRKLGVKSPYAVANRLKGEVWFTEVRRNRTHDVENADYSYRASVGESAAKRFLPANYLHEKFIARTFEQGSHEIGEELEWIDGKISIDKGEDYDIFEYKGGDLPWDEIYFMPIRMNARVDPQELKKTDASSTELKWGDWKVI